jgi:DNA-binding XRE family transcriptional regulator
LEGTGERFLIFEEARPAALRGEWSAVTVVVRLWLGLVDDVLNVASADFPDLVKNVDDRVALLTASNELSEEPVMHLDRLIGEILFSPLLARFGTGLGVGVAAIEAIRSLLPGCPALHVDESPGWPDLPLGADTEQYRRLVDLALRSMQPPLAKAKESFGLNNSELAQFFGVTRQAVDQWERSGEVPTARRDKLAKLVSLGELLESKLGPGRLSLVAWRRVDGFNGKTMLDLVAEDRDSDLSALTEQMFE